MDTWTLQFGEDGEAPLVADELAIGVAICAEDGSLRRANAAFRELLGPSLPVGPEALVGLLLAAGVGEARERLDAAGDSAQDIVLRRGGRARPIRLQSHLLPGGHRLYLFHERRDDGAAQARLAELQSLIAHDLRSPLAVIQGYAGLLATGQPGPLNPTQAEFLGGIDTKIVEVTRLLDDFLDLSRLEAGALRLRPETIRVAEIVAQVCQEQRQEAAGRKIAVAVRIEPEDLEVAADPLRLKQVIENLLGNAVKYNREGGWVRLAATIIGSQVEIRVTDGGPGIAADELASVFEPFARGAAGGSVAGSGLGLAVVQRLVALHGGSIAASSDPEQGTVFSVRLPRQPVGAVQ